MAKERYTATQVADALDRHKGMVYLAAEALGCSHVTVYNYAKRYKMVQEAIDRNRGHVVDTAELALYNAILNGEHWAVAFALKTIGKDRGYTSKQEIDIYLEQELNRALDKLQKALSPDDYRSVLAALSDGPAGEAKT